MENLEGSWILIMCGEEKARMTSCNLTPGLRAQALINALVAGAVEIGIGRDELIDAAGAAIEEQYKKYEEESEA